jgi:hypothetical protein
MPQYVPRNQYDFNIHVRIGIPVIDVEDQEVTFATIEVDGQLVWAGPHSEQGTTEAVEHIIGEILVNGNVKQPA